MLELLSYPLLATGLGLGLLHAFDADHIMAVSALANDDKKTKAITRYASMWAIGHGSVLLLMGGVAILFGLAFPEALSQWAEYFVGFMLIALGAYSLRSLHKQRLHINIHSHGDIHHAHYVVKESNRHDHRPLFVGVAHGAAGSAPALALLPAINHQSAISTLFYLVIFSIGVLTSMTIFGTLLAYAQKGMGRIHTHFVDTFRAVISIATIFLGFYWVAS
jgi:nickel/cobalt exporter